jgi:hypothetical protein
MFVILSSNNVKIVEFACCLGHDDQLKYVFIKLCMAIIDLYSAIQFQKKKKLIELKLMRELNRLTVFNFKAI